MIERPHPRRVAPLGERRESARQAVPKARRFTEDGAFVATGPRGVLTKRVVSTDGGVADAPLDSDDELEARMRAPRVTPSGSSRGSRGGRRAAAAKKKKKKDKSRLTDLEDYDLEGEDPETTEEMLRRKASKKAGDSRVLQKVFGDIDDISDEDTRAAENAPRSVRSEPVPSADPALVSAADRWSSARACVNPVSRRSRPLGGAPRRRPTPLRWPPSSPPCAVPPRRRSPGRAHARV